MARAGQRMKKTASRQARRAFSAYYRTLNQAVLAYLGLTSFACLFAALYHVGNPMLPPVGAFFLLCAVCLYGRRLMDELRAFGELRRGAAVKAAVTAAGVFEDRRHNLYQRSHHAGNVHMVLRDADGNEYRLCAGKERTALEDAKAALRPGARFAVDYLPKSRVVLGLRPLYQENKKAGNAHDTAAFRKAFGHDVGSAENTWNA